MEGDEILDDVAVTGILASMDSPLGFSNDNVNWNDMVSYETAAVSPYTLQPYEGNDLSNDLSSNFQDAYLNPPGSSSNPMDSQQMASEDVTASTLKREANVEATDKDLQYVSKLSGYPESIEMERYEAPKSICNQSAFQDFNETFSKIERVAVLPGLDNIFQPQASDEVTIPTGYVNEDMVNVDLLDMIMDADILSDSDVDILSSTRPEKPDLKQEITEAALECTSKPEKPAQKKKNEGKVSALPKCDPMLEKPVKKKDKPKAVRAVASTSKRLIKQKKDKTKEKKKKTKDKVSDAHAVAILAPEKLAEQEKLRAQEMAKLMKRVNARCDAINKKKADAEANRKMQHLIEKSKDKKNKTSILIDPIIPCNNQKRQKQTKGFTLPKNPIKTTRPVNMAAFHNDHSYESFLVASKENNFRLAVVSSNRAIAMSSLLDKAKDVVPKHEEDANKSIHGKPLTLKLADVSNVPLPAELLHQSIRIPYAYESLHSSSKNYMLAPNSAYRNIATLLPNEEGTAVQVSIKEEVVKSTDASIQPKAAAPNHSTANLPDHAYAYVSKNNLNSTPKEEYRSTKSPPSAIKDVLSRCNKSESTKSPSSAIKGVLSRVNKSESKPVNNSYDIKFSFRPNVNVCQLLNKLQTDNNSTATATAPSQKSNSNIEVSRSRNCSESSAMSIDSSSESDFLKETSTSPAQNVTSSQDKDGLYRSLSTCRQRRTYNSRPSHRNSRSRSRSRDRRSSRYGGYDDDSVERNYTRSSRYGGYDDDSFTRNYMNHMNSSSSRYVREQVVYIGKVGEDATENMLRREFEKFGHIEAVNLYFRRHNDNYAFVTYARTEDANDAVKNSCTDPDLCKYQQVCFGKRRGFCGRQYEDLDNFDESETVEEVPRPNDQDDYAALLRDYQRQQKMSSRSRR